MKNTYIKWGCSIYGWTTNKKYSNYWGNICNGAVSADSVPALFALNALLKLKSVNGERIVEIRDFYNGPGKVKIDKNEILTEVLIKEKEYINKQGKYIKFTNRNALDISMLGVAIVCEENKGEINDLRIALGVAAPIPLRCIKAEAYGIGKNTQKVLLIILQLLQWMSLAQEIHGEDLRIIDYI